MIEDGINQFLLERKLIFILFDSVQMCINLLLLFV